MTDVVFDTGALIAIENRSAYMIALLKEIKTGNVLVHVPACVLAQAWRGGRRQALLATFLKDKRTRVVPLDRNTALLVGALCAQTGRSDVVDASVVHLALDLGAAIVSSDAAELLTLASDLTIFSV